MTLSTKERTVTDGGPCDPLKEAEDHNTTTPQETAVHENLAKAQEMGHKAYGATKEATVHAVSAVKTLLGDPMGGQGKALAMLGDAKALSAGLVFSALFCASAVILGYFAYLAPQGSRVGLIDYLTLFLVALTLPAALWASFVVVGKVFGGKASRNACAFAAGVALLPMVVILLVLSILGPGNIEVLAVTGLFGMTLTVLLLNSALLDVLKLSTRQAVLLTPTLILVTGYTAKMIGFAFLR